jgi:hypothetical protein
MVQPKEEVVPYTWQVLTLPPVFATLVSRAVSTGFHFLKIVHLNQQASEPFLFMTIRVVEFSNGGYKIRKNKNQHTQRK